MQPGSQILWCPFEARLNPAVADADAQSKAWATRMGLLASPTTARRIEAARIAEFIARIYPDATLDALVLATEMNVWLFAHDDACDHEALGRSPAALRALHGELVAIVAGAAPANSSSELGRALADLVPRIRAITSAACERRFVDAVTEYLEACAAEACNRALDRVPGMSEYVRMRRHTGTARIAFALLGPCEDIALSDAVWEHPAVQALVDACNDALCWANDLLSWDRERAAGEVHNLVAVLARHRCRGDLVLAKALASHAHDARVADFLRLAAALPCFDRETNALLERLTETLGLWMGGHLEWARSVERYVVRPGLRVAG